MNISRIVTLGLIALLGSLALAAPGFADPAQQGIIVVPPSNQIQAEIHVAKQSFQVGETIQIFFSVTQNAFVNIVDIDATGRCTLIFPNVFSNANFVQAGQHALPDRPTYNFVVTPPAGTEFVQVIASLDALDLRTLFNTGSNDPFPTLCTNPQTFAQQVQAAIQGIVAVGKVATAFVSFQVVGNQPSNRPPVPQLRVMPSTPFVGQTVQFDASGSFDPDGSIVRYDWDFNGDGIIDQTTTTPFTTFNYSTPGLVFPRVTVTDNQGAQASAQQQISVQGGPPNRPPVAGFNVFPPNPAVGQPVTFNSTSFDPDGNPIVQTQWNFGDGSTGFGQTVQHAYFAPGAFQVTLTVTDSLGASGQTSQLLTVGFPGPSVGQTGFTVNAVDNTHFRISVQGDPNWFSDHLFKIILDTDGIFTSVQQQTSGNASAQGIVPTPNPMGNHLELNGAVRSGRIDFTIGISPNTTKIKFDLRLDADGNGTPERNRNLIFLGDRLVHPPSDPFIITLSGNSLIPFTSIQVCLVLIDQPGFSFSICFRFGDLF
jgi:PKD repeat protein